MVICVRGLTVPAIPMATELLLEPAQVSGGCVSRPLLQTSTHIFFRYLVTLGSWRVTKVRDLHLCSRSCHLGPPKKELLTGVQTARYRSPWM